MKKWSFLMMFALGVWSFQSCGDAENDSIDNAQEMNEEKRDSTDNTAVPPEDDTDFVVKTASGSMMEVELGKLAEQKAQNQSVKDYAAMMVKEHNAANDELKSLAQTKNITIPATIGEDHQEDINDLREKTGADFDKAYMSEMVDQHKEMVDKFEKRAENADDADVKAWATKMLPKLREHLEKARSIHDGLK